MTQPDRPGDTSLPPDLPAEYADAYRRAYERARDDGPAQVVVEKAPGWRWPVVAGVGVLLVLLAAYALGRGFGGGSGNGDAQGAPAAATISDAGPTESPTPSRGHGPTPTRSAAPTGEAWDGDVKPVPVGSVTSSCRYPASVDAAGHRVTYRPGEAADADFTTAWRCAGDGKGAYLRIELPDEATVAEVGLVPGYAKTDPNNHADRYAENNRITKVRWTFDDGTSVEQNLDGSPRRREPQTMRIVPTSTGSVTVTILDSARGPRNTVAISEVTLGQQVG